MSAPAMVICGVVVLALALPVVGAASALEVRERSAAAADSAALAAADSMSGRIEGYPCEVAERVALEFRVTLTECSLDPLSGEARVITRSETVLGPVQARARAGPPTG